MTIDHIGIVCKNLTEAKKLINYFDLLNYKPSQVGYVEDYKVNCIFLSNQNSEIEIIYPYNNKSVISNYLKKYTNKLHHIAYKVKNTEKFKNKLKPEKVKGAKKNMYVTFIDPKETGILIELVEYHA